ncbi:MAG: PSP family protein, partial [Eisenbergiella sp.]
DMYSYESEDRNGNRVFVGFKTVFHWDDDVGRSESYYISTMDYSDVEVSQKLWEELFSLLQEARSETPEPETYEEFFKGFY